MSLSIQFTSFCIALAALMITLTNPAPTRRKKGASRHSPRDWTLEEAVAQLRLHPHDAYLQYVALQLARREGRLDEVVLGLQEMMNDQTTSSANERRDSVDLFSLFSGALAVQESLQLDAMRPGRSEGGRLGQ